MKLNLSVQETFFRLLIDGEESGEDEDNELEADMEMGDVNQSEEDKLDPDLWDQNGDNEKELADGSEGLISIF